MRVFACFLLFSFFVQLMPFLLVCLLFVFKYLLVCCYACFVVHVLCLLFAIFLLD